MADATEAKQYNRKALKAGAWYTVSSFLVKGIAMLTTPFFTRLLSQAEMGEYSNLVSWISILSIVLTLELYSSVNLAHYDFPDDIYGYMSSMLALGSLTTLIFYFPAMFFQEQISAFLGIEPYMLHVMFLYFLVSPALQVLQVKFRVSLEYRQNVLLSFSSVLLSTGLSFLLVFIMEDRLQGRIIGQYGVLILMYTIVYIYIMARGHEVKLQYWKYGLAISLPMLLHYLAGSVLSSSDRVMITNFCGKADNALYSVSYTCALVVSVLWTSLNQAWSPWCYEMMHRKDYGAIRKNSKPLVVCFCILVGGMMLLAPELLYIMGGEGYMQAVYVIPPVMAGYVAQLMYTLYVNIEFFNKKQKYVMFGTVIAAGLNVALNLICIPLFGYLAAAYTTFACYIVLFLIHYAFVCHMKLSQVYDFRFLSSMLLGMLGLTLAVSVLYRLPVLRYILLAVGAMGVTGIVMQNRKILLQALKQRDVMLLLHALKPGAGKRED